jgi:hypothetical protein
MLNALVNGYEYVKLALYTCEQNPVFKPTPSNFGYGLGLIVREGAFDIGVHAFIKEDAHSSK